MSSTAQRSSKLYFGDFMVKVGCIAQTNGIKTEVSYPFINKNLFLKFYISFLIPLELF